MSGASAADLARAQRELAAALFPDGGLLLHLASGEIFELDSRGAALWGAIIGARDIASAVTQIGDALACTPAQALATLDGAVRHALRIDPGPAAETYRFSDDGASMALCRRDQPLIVFDRADATLSYRPVPGPSTSLPKDDLTTLIGLFLPKVLASWYPLAMHASAVATDGGALLLSGRSGAGKTTTARSLARDLPSTRLLSEDVVLLSAIGQGSAVVGGIEPILGAWIAEAAAQLAAAPTTARPSLQPLAAELRRAEPAVPLKRIVFLDAGRRVGRAWSFRPLRGTAALRLVFLNSFLPSSRPDALTVHLAACRDLASATEVWEASAIPLGLVELQADSRGQREMIAS